MQLILTLFFLCVLIYYSLLLFEWVLRAIGIIKPPYKPYSFENDVLKPLGYTYADYCIAPSIGTIIKVQNKLGEELLKRISEPDWAQVKYDLDQNKKLEEQFIERLKEPLC